VTENLSVDELLLILQVAFLVLLYLFIWRIVRTAAQDIRLPQESFVHAPGVGGPARSPVLVVASSPTLPPGEEHELNSVPLTVGRSADNDLELRGDKFASAHHARFESRPDGAWVADLRSTNGTFVNGIRLDGSQRLITGDVVRVGETDLRYEE
jgi:pSer/pThr/pTyr-binding forkhead associated (FHA) protein